MSEEYIFSDMHYQLKVDSSGNPQRVYDQDAIDQSIKSILGTVSGERLRSPIGSSLLGLLFEPMNDDLAYDIQIEISRVISEYEPRVEVIDVAVVPNYDLGAFEIFIAYRIRNVNGRYRFETKLKSLFA